LADFKIPTLEVALSFPNKKAQQWPHQQQLNSPTMSLTRFLELEEAFCPWL
jgi:hypothetical protein